LCKVTLLERKGTVGGNAASFEIAGLNVDYGSHRLHPACDPEVFQDIRSLLGEDLLDRPRHGRIRLRRRWIHFPLMPVDLALNADPGFVLGIGTDQARKVLKGNNNTASQETFASVMERGLGRTICNDFYFPYARKIWGLEPEELSAAQARRRVSNNSISRMFRKVLSAIPGLKPKGSGRFFYPRNGYGQISEAYYQAAQSAGAEICLNAAVKSVEIQGDSGKGSRFRIDFETDGVNQSVTASQVWSTIPITLLARMVKPGPQQELLAATSRIDYRAMILVYLVLEQDRFSEYDAHYFPETNIAITRLSEPKNYSNRSDPHGLTVLCAELPCSPQSPEWTMPDEDLGLLVRDALATARIPVQAPIRQVVIKRLRNAYPIYRQGYEEFFDPLDEWIGSINGLLTFGRQGLFAHDNTHHALFMAYSAVKCVKPDGGFDSAKWQDFRRIFETHVVED
jgi:protoporphyrinogen oxidase